MAAKTVPMPNCDAIGFYFENLCGSSLFVGQTSYFLRIFFFRGGSSRAEAVGDMCFFCGSFGRASTTAELARDTAVIGGRSGE